ncbi:T9SS type A sorting domain-containing protein [Pontibacter sp. G13]|uniref:T9SS type A sorting domain-containing protein n=1 Tax=Pontibacter sp. G13 TaxID=3074898 RepID=UPI0028895166|nr:T9SS type A sorting domain-containing protein [Pontibacter sp. G13]WNJ17875.1 T9SS type A sorting domain-containing protein [Pontibacter sp. G13]
MKKWTILLLSQLLVIQAFAQALGYNNNRIAVSADGNNQPDLNYTGTYNTADPDDWGATPATLTMLAKLQMQDVLVHYSYNNFMPSPPHTTETNYMKEACDQAISRFGFEDSIFFDVGTHQQQALQHLADELAKSTAQDPLYFLHMGPSEFFYQAVKLVVDAGTNLNALSHVYVISHSGYNDTHLRRPTEHTMTQTITMSGNRLNYTKIKDQNNCNVGWQLWCSGTNEYPWRDIRDHEDPHVQWLWARMQDHKHGKYDISDAGLMWYLLKGDEDGSPAKLTNFLGYGILLPGEAVATDIDIEEAAVTIFTQKAYQLSFGFTPVEPWDDYYSFSTSDAGVVYVSPHGRLVGVGAGTATVTVTGGIGEFTDQVQVTVRDGGNCTDESFNAIDDVQILEVDGFVPSYKDVARNAIGVDASQYQGVFGASQYIFTGTTGYYDVSLTTLTEIDGESSYRLSVNGELVGEFQNPETQTDYVEFTETFPYTLVRNGDVIQIESNTHSNGKVVEGAGFAFARGRWKSVQLDCSASCELEERDGLLVIEAERFNLKGKWRVVEGDPVSSGNKYIEYYGPNSYNSQNLSNEIDLTFEIKTPGRYTFKWFMRQPDEAEGDLSNDVWIKMDGNVGLSNGTPISNYAKFVGRSKGVFTMNGALDINHVSSAFGADFPAPGNYTIKITGRSEFLQIDRIVFFKNGINLDDAVFMASEVTETTTCSDVVVPNSMSVDVRAFIQAGITVYPNPASDQLHVKFETQPAQPMQLHLYDLNGRKVKADTVQDLVHSVNLAGLSAGLYLLVLENQEAVYRQKVMIRR